MISSFKPTPVAKAISLALLLAGSTFAAAQGTPAATEAEAKKAAEAKKQLDTVQVTGIRASTEQSLLMKRDASANVDVITALDVGKMPDKNLADSLQRVVGVYVRTDYDEAEKVSMRGTNPDMALILFNGHTVSGGDWYLADQSSSSRSTSLSLMPSSVLNAATVYKTSQANIVDGGLAGTINVTTRKPLDQKKSFGGVVSVGGVYADLPKKTSPQLNASFNWKNEANNFGVIGQAFAEKRYVRRDSVSRAGYGANSGWDVIDTSIMKGITDASLAGTGLKASDLQGVRLPGSMAVEFVEGVRDRKGGMLALQARPTDKLDVGLTGFYSKMNSNNFGRAAYSNIQSMLRGLNGVQGATTPVTSSGGKQVFAEIKNPVIVEETTLYGHTLKVLKSADILYPAGTTPQLVGENEGFYRSGAAASSGFLDLDFKYQVANNLTVKGLVSTTRGVGTTDQDRGYGFARYGTGMSYTLNGLTEAPDFRFYGTGANVPVQNADGSGYRLVAANGANKHHTVDREKSVALDAEYTQDNGFLSSLNFGLRRADHRRDYRRTIKAVHTAAVPQFDPNLAVSYPSDFGKYLGGGNWDHTGFYFPSNVLVDYFNVRNKETTPEWERFVSSEISLRERQTAFYAMQNLEGANNKWSGNVGFRFVRTEVDALIPTPIPSGVCARTEPGKTPVPCAAFPDAITTARQCLGLLRRRGLQPGGPDLVQEVHQPDFRQCAAQHESAGGAGRQADRPPGPEPDHRPPELQHLRHGSFQPDLRRHGLHGQRPQPRHEAADGAQHGRVAGLVLCPPLHGLDQRLQLADRRLCQDRPGQAGLDHRAVRHGDQPDAYVFHPDDDAAAGLNPRCGSRLRAADRRRLRLPVQRQHGQDQGGRRPPDERCLQVLGQPGRLL